MKDKTVQAVEDIIRSIPADKIIPFKEAITISMNLFTHSGSRKPIDEIIQMLKKRYVEDLITIQHVSPNSADALMKKGANLSDENFQFIKMITDELRKFPGGYLTHRPEELQPLVYKLIECDTTEEWLICQSDRRALLLDTDGGLATIGVMALAENDNEMVVRIYQKRDRIAMFRKKIQESMD